MKCNENPSNSSRVVTSGQGDVATYCREWAKHKEMFLQYYRRIRHTTQHNAANEHVVMVIGKA